MTPRITSTEDIQLIGCKTRMSIVENKTANLWQTLMPRRNEITNSVGKELYSVEVYDDLSFFDSFNPKKEFEKWAAVPVSDAEKIPDQLHLLNIPSGDYAVFHYKGKPSEAQATYQYIYGQWLPSSEYVLDNRPHFAVMGEKYRGEHPESEEELWIPIRKP